MTTSKKVLFIALLIFSLTLAGCSQGNAVPPNPDNTIEPPGGVTITKMTFEEAFRAEIGPLGEDNDECLTKLRQAYIDKDFYEFTNNLIDADRILNESFSHFMDMTETISIMRDFGDMKAFEPQLNGIIETADVANLRSVCAFLEEIGFIYGERDGEPPAPYKDWPGYHEYEISGPFLDSMISFVNTQISFERVYADFLDMTDAALSDIEDIPL